MKGAVLLYNRDTVPFYKPNGVYGLDSALYEDWQIPKGDSNSMKFETQVVLLSTDSTPELFRIQTEYGHKRASLVGDVEISGSGLNVGIDVKTGVDIYRVNIRNVDFVLNTNLWSYTKP